MVDLIGDLSLNALDGHCGLPVGHIVAYKPNHFLNAKFVQVRECGQSRWGGFGDAIGSSGRTSTAECVL